MSTIPDAESLGFPRDEHVMEKRRVKEIERGPNIFLQHNMFVQQSISEHVESNPGDVQT